MKISQGTDQKF